MTQQHIFRNIHIFSYIIYSWSFFHLSISLFYIISFYPPNVIYADEQGWNHLYLYIVYGIWYSLTHLMNSVISSFGANYTQNTLNKIQKMCVLAWYVSVIHLCIAYTVSQVWKRYICCHRHINIYIHDVMRLHFQEFFYLEFMFWHAKAFI